MARSRAALSGIADLKRLAWSCLAGDELLQSPPCLCANVCGAVSVLVSDEGSVTRGVVDELGDECDVVTGHRSAFIAAAAGAGPPWKPPFARWLSRKVLPSGAFNGILGCPRTSSNVIVTRRS